VRIRDHRLTIQVPRVYDSHTKEMKPLESYERLRRIIVDDEYLMRGIMLGLSVRDFADLNSNPSAKALSKSAVDQAFIEGSAERLKQFEERRFDDTSFVALFIDGKYLVGDQIVLVLGVTVQGVKIPLGFVQTTSEHHQPCSDLFKSLIQRGLQASEGVLCILDGAKGFKKAVANVFGSQALIQRCQWHKRENALSYLAKDRQDPIKKRMQDAWSLPTLKEAQSELEILAQELERENRSAASSLREGLSETLTLHWLTMTEFARGFGTTNCIENLNSLLGRTTRNVKRWTNSLQRHRWVAAGLLEAEQRMRKVDNFERLPYLQKAITAAVRSQNFN
jgi:putative transposase